jgi:hypothetical protein
MDLLAYFPFSRKESSLMRSRFSLCGYIFVFLCVHFLHLLNQLPDFRVIPCGRYAIEATQRLFFLQTVLT